MQLNRTLRIAGFTASGVALGLLPSVGAVGAHEDPTGGPGLQGRVVSVGSGEFVVESGPGDTQTIDTTASTTYTEVGNSTPLPGVLNGEWVARNLDPSSASPSATSVIVFPESAGGTVTGASGSTIMLASRWGPRTIVVGPGTSYTEKGVTSIDVSDGEFVVASGLPDQSTPGAIDAQNVSIVSPSTPVPFTAIPSGERPCPPQAQVQPTAQPDVTADTTAPSGVVSHQPEAAPSGPPPTSFPSSNGWTSTPGPRPARFGSASGGYWLQGHGDGGPGGPGFHQGGPGGGFHH
jgi:hypothetical protein